MRYILALLAMIPLSASAQGFQAMRPMTCGPTESLKNFLTGKHNEQPVLSGVTIRGELFELWMSSNGESWTATLTLPNECISCMLIDGNSLSGGNPVPVPKEKS